MKLLVPILILITSNAFGQSGGMGRAVVNNDTILFSGKTVDFIGNSIVLGNVGVSPQSNRWPTQFCTLKGATENNLGISGQILENVAACSLPIFDKATIPSYTVARAAVFIALGINDVGMNTNLMSPALFQRTLDTVVSYAITTKGWPAKRIILVTPYWFTNYANYDAYTTCGHVLSNPKVHVQYVDAVFNVSVKYNTGIADIYSAMAQSSVRGTFLAADGLHPNNTGATFIAATFNTMKFYYQ